MAEFSALTLCTQSQLCTRRFQSRNPISYDSMTLSRSSDLMVHLSKCSLWKDRGVTYTLISRKATASQNSLAIRFMTGCPNRKSSLTCCMATLLNAPNSASLSWVSTIDQILLVITIVFTYMAGVVPHNATHTSATNNTVEGTANASGVTFPGSTTDKTSANFNDPWVQVERKLLDALDAANRNNDLLETVIKWDNLGAKSPLSLLAIKGGSRLRLLVATLQRLRKEVPNISQAHERASRDTRLVISSYTIQGSVQPIFLNWLEGELSLQKKGREKELIYGALGKLGEDDSILQKIKLLAKADLYGDLLFFLRFGSHSAYYYDDCIFMRHKIEILEDLVITLADGICSIYLELISLDSTLSPEVNYIGSSLCCLSTRALQKLRNQVALDQWLIQNFESVVSMYEDRFDLFVLKKKPLEDPDMDVAGTFNLLKSSLFKKQSSVSSLDYIVISQLPLFVRRTKELKALAGWRYYYSLFLELSDIVMPLIKAAFVKAKNAVSFFLTCLIGRSLGLIYAGIRQSLGWG